MALTKEERAQRAEERRKENEEWERRFPRARFMDQSRNQDCWVQLVLEPAESSRLEIRVRGNRFAPEEQYEDVHHAVIHLDADLSALAALIRGLTCRYNAMIEDLNATIESTPPLRLAKSLTQESGSHD